MFEFVALRCCFVCSPGQHLCTRPLSGPRVGRRRKRVGRGGRTKDENGEVVRHMFACVRVCMCVCLCVCVCMCVHCIFVKIFSQPGLPVGVLTFSIKECLRVSRPSGSPNAGRRLPQLLCPVPPT